MSCEKCWKDCAVSCLQCKKLYCEGCITEIHQGDASKSDHTWKQVTKKDLEKQVTRLEATGKFSDQKMAKIKRKSAAFNRTSTILPKEQKSIVPMEGMKEGDEDAPLEKKSSEPALEKTKTESPGDLAKLAKEAQAKPTVEPVAEEPAKPAAAAKPAEAPKKEEEKPAEAPKKEEPKKEMAAPAAKEEPATNGDTPETAKKDDAPAAEKVEAANGTNGTAEKTEPATPAKAKAGVLADPAWTKLSSIILDKDIMRRVDKTSEYLQYLHLLATSRIGASQIEFSYVFVVHTTVVLATAVSTDSSCVMTPHLLPHSAENFKLLSVTNHYYCC
eukprot:g12242.t1